MLSVAAAGGGDMRMIMRLLAVLLLVAVAVPAYAQTNLLVDPSLENWTSATNATSWTESDTAGGSVTVTRSATAYAGTYAAQLGQNDELWQVLTLAPGTYTLSAEIQGTGTLLMGVWTTGWATVGQQTCTPTASWQLCSVVVTVPSNTSYNVLFSNSGAAGSALLVDILGLFSGTTTPTNTATRTNTPTNTNTNTPTNTATNTATNTVTPAADCGVAGNLLIQCGFEGGFTGGLPVGWSGQPTWSLYPGRTANAARTTDEVTLSLYQVVTVATPGIYRASIYSAPAGVNAILRIYSADGVTQLANQVCSPAVTWGQCTVDVDLPAGSYRYSVAGNGSVGFAVDDASLVLVMAATEVPTPTPPFLLHLPLVQQ